MSRSLNQPSHGPIPVGSDPRFRSQDSAQDQVDSTPSILDTSFDLRVIAVVFTAAVTVQFSVGLLAGIDPGLVRLGRHLLQEAAELLDQLSLA